MTPVSSSRRGSILIVVMWVALGLVTLALYFANTISLEYRAADQIAAGFQASQAIAGAQRYLAFVLANPTTPGTAPDLEAGEYTAENAALGAASYWIIGRDANSDVLPSTPVFGLMDEAARLNINSATLEMIEALPGMTPELAAAIVDWRDTDEDLTVGGAESQDYLALTTPYNAKNAEFETPEELRLVREMTPALLYGEDANRNGALDANENDADASWPPDNADGSLDPGLLEYITTFTRERNKREDGTPRINIRGQNRQELTQLLTDKISAQRASEIMTAVEASLANMNSRLEFFIQSHMTADEFRLIENDISTSDADYLPGLVNVRYASVPVLACLPGMDEALAARLVAARRDLDTDALSSVAWVADVIDASIAAEMGPYITARSQQFSADIVGLGREGRGFRRRWIVFDVEDEVNVIYSRDLTRAGWPLQSEFAAVFHERIRENTMQ